METKIAAKIEEFFSKFSTQKYRKGEILVRAGDDPTGVFYLKSGRVKKYAISQKGDELIVNIFKPISFFPMSHAITNLPNNYFYEAMENLELKKASYDDAREFIKSNPAVLLDLLARVYRGTEGILTRMTYLMTGNAYSRLVAELIIAGKRFGEKNGKTTAFKISEKDLAAEIGMTRETVSREMKNLKERGLVDFNKGRLVIRNMNKLENELYAEF